MIFIRLVICLLAAGSVIALPVNRDRNIRTLSVTKLHTKYVTEGCQSSNDTIQHKETTYFMSNAHENVLSVNLKTTVDLATLASPTSGTKSSGPYQASTFSRTFGASSSLIPAETATYSSIEAASVSTSIASFLSDSSSLTTKWETSSLIVVSSESFSASSFLSPTSKSTSSLLLSSSDVHETSGTSSLAEIPPSTSKSESQSSSTATLSLKTLLSQSVGDSAISNTIDKVWKRFWSTDKSKWNDNDSICGSSFDAVVLWDQAVVGRAITNSKDSTKINQIMNNIANYRNDKLGAYSAGEGGTEDVYTDDNAQLAWVFIDAYQVTGNEDYLNKAKAIVSFIEKQVDVNGGVLWKYKHTYIASISTVEAALAAMRLYDVSQSDTLITFAESCMNFMFKYFQDPSDHLFYDGLDKDNYKDLNKGKLSYTVGCALSTLAYLVKYTGNQKWLSSAIELGNAATNKSGAFYNGDKIWNNQLQYVHLLYAGFADLLNIVDWNNDFDSFRDEVKRQGAFVYNFLQDSQDSSLYFNLATSSTKTMFNHYHSYFDDGTFSEDLSIYCNSNLNGPTKKVLMDNASTAQILFELSRIE